MGHSAISRQLYITIEAGETQSQELFDFNSPDNRIIADQVIRSNAFIVHDGENIICQANLQLKESTLTQLYSVKLEPNSIQLKSMISNEKTLWRVLQPGQAFPLELGTLIKIGKVKMRLKEIVQEQKEMTQKQFAGQSLHEQLEEVKSLSNFSNISHQNQCRICFESSNGKENPLVCLCKCSGTVKYIHFQCLKDWINNHVVRRQHNNTLFFSYQQTKCQICQEAYQPEFTHNGRKYLLLNLENAPAAPYAIFEEVDFEEENRRFSVFLIGLGQEEITFGRNSNSNVVMKEISVSRTHCTLTYRNKTLFIRDKGSKFGTLVKVDSDIEFSPTTGLNLQYESKLIRIHDKGRLGCCCAQEDNFLLRLTKDKQDHSVSFSERF